MPTYLLRRLVLEGPTLDDAAYEALEADTRSALISLLVAPDCALTFSEAAAQHNHPEEDKKLYLGNHECGDRHADDPDDIYIELWAWLLDDPSDWVSWAIATVDGTCSSEYEIDYCPFCGCHLRTFLIRDATAQAPND